MTEDKERKYNEAIGMCMLAMAMLMTKLSDMGDKPTAEESALMCGAISKCGDLIDPNEGMLQ